MSELENVSNAVAGTAKHGTKTLDSDDKLGVILWKLV